MASEEYTGKPFKIVDSKREHKIGIVATSLSDFMTKGKHIFKMYERMHFMFLLNLNNLSTLNNIENSI